MASARNSSKRRRLLGDARCLSDLPSGILTHVANYLAPPSRALFAAALTTHQNSAASDERNSAIVGNEWTTLDFGDIEKDLAVKLIDADISAVLMCINAVNRLKWLKLTNCINITGVGLEPLRGSTIIEQIDLSLVGKHQSPILKPKPPISCEFVLPILDSIIEREGCSLRHLQFPSACRAEDERVQFEEFFGRYNEMLVNRGASCLKCNANLPREDRIWIGESNLQNYTCYECLKHYCEQCKHDDSEYGEYMLNCCELCEKQLCADCETNIRCIGCEFDYCVGCMDFTDCSGTGCDADICKDCIASGDYNEKCWKCERYFCHENCVLSNRCDSCKKNCCDDCEEEYEYDWPQCRRCSECFCDNCNEKNGTDAIRFCDDCDTCYCGKCRVSMCQEVKAHMNCAGCIQLAGPLLLEENQTLRNENNGVKAENATLKDTNRYGHEHINWLKEQLQYQKKKFKDLEEKTKQLKTGKDG